MLECYVDGSWDQNGKAGMGLCLFQQGNVVAWSSKPIPAISPSKAEAMAVLDGVRLLTQQGNRQGVVMSDSKETVHSPFAAI